VVQEFVHAYSRRRERSTAAEHGRRYATLLAPLLEPDERALLLGLDLFERHEGLDAFDAVLAATAIHAGAEALVSADRAFAGVEELRHVDPLDAEVETLLGEV
jgi:predicted nucleic acid-binding protein